MRRRRWSERQHREWETQQRERPFVLDGRRYANEDDYNAARKAAARATMEWVDGLDPDLRERVHHLQTGDEAIAIEAEADQRAGIRQNPWHRRG